MPARKPTRLKRLTGTLRKDRENPNEPTPAPGAPPPRRGMAPATRAWYRRLAALLDAQRITTKMDAAALELLSDALAERDQARLIVLRDGAVYQTTTPAGCPMWRPHPCVAIAADAWRRASTMLKEYGLTSASRARVNAAPEDVPPTVWAKLHAAALDRKYFDRTTPPAPRRRRAGAPLVGGFYTDA